MSNCNLILSCVGFFALIHAGAFEPQAMPRSSKAPISGSGSISVSKSTYVDPNTGYTYTTYTGGNGQTGTIEKHTTENPDGYTTYYSNPDGSKQATLTYSLVPDSDPAYSNPYYDFVGPNGNTAEVMHNSALNQTYAKGPLGNSIWVDNADSTEYEKIYQLNVVNQPFGLLPKYYNPYGFYNVQEQYYTDPTTGTTTQIYSNSVDKNSVVRVTDPSTGQAYIVGPNGYFYRQVDTEPTSGTTNANWSYYYDNTY